MAMDASDPSDSPLPTVETDNVEPSSDPNSTEADHKSEDEQATSYDKGESKEEPDYTAKTVELIVEILKKLGCQPDVEDRQTVNVKYQGENFQFYANGIIVNIYDLPWSHFNINAPNAQKIREAINKANFSTLPMVLMTVPDEDGDVQILSRYETILHSSCTVNEDYVHYILDSFFSAKRQVHEICLEIATQQQKPAENRRPVGFATE